MCGIVGHLSFDRQPDDLAGMLGLIAHRGPDDSGVYDGGCIRLGFRRLAIVDLSAAGHQPMANEDGSLWLVFNGEIYNYRELVPRLKAYGHVFRSQTDSEAIIHAYEQWGVACLQQFNGMFAFALWDARSNTLFCARDRFGVKPFYYATPAEGRGMLFASEIKALLRHPRAPRREANRQMIYDFLAAGLLDHTDQTCFAGIAQLPPAHYLLASVEGTRVERYWQVPDEGYDEARAVMPAQRRRWAAEFRELLEDAVRLRLHADVPVGTCLSGGLDSSAIVCLANQLLFGHAAELPWHERGDRQKTFSACYDDARHDERRYIEQVLSATGAEANYTFPGRDAELQTVIPEVIWHQEEPFGSTSILAQWHVMESASHRGVTVLLDGQGADELLGGYHGYFGAALADDLAGGHLTRLVRDLQLYHRYHAPSWRHVVRSTLHGLLPPTSSIRGLVRMLSSADRAAPGWLTPTLAHGRRLSTTWVPRHATRLQTLLYNQATRTSLPALLHYEDRNSMAFSIEARTPFLDYRLAELLFQLPNGAHLEHGLTKTILREAMRGVLPEQVRTRLDKKGFSTPEDQWFRTTLRDWIREILCSKSLAERGFVQPDKVQALFEQHIAGRGAESATLWRVVNVELWARMFLDQPPVAPEPVQARQRAHGRQLVSDALQVGER